ncbi:aminotransferase class I/II-fold pyridoxal phosphate-dependent enzyme [Cytobacillus solani]|uniref:Pyridoxal phosphate-dependent aminotransferase n=1 Tax=Cytobacillus solani TaxID=1637975 RepID=A0A0Q3VGI5_9BACI|nr:aminotransferase class I/II-fold pyridoxal phosphate-dependent enzyme [Cytobacillus solani]KOP71088.1 pyridoxal phosphate-dependent aminotransferase [Bacillus sp. FJAT-21945]KQL17967.1 pyridoxal phosphate-dependent aminotransferase [Cytobacillus solani]
MIKTIQKNRIALSVPHMSGNEMKYIQEAFNSNWIAPLGSNVDAFEKEMAGFVGANGAVAVNSGTAAIHLALILLNVKKGDTVFCSSLTFVASANPILYEGAEPVFIDSEPETWNMSPNALERAFQEACENNQLPKAVIIVNLFGQSAKMDELALICKRYGVPIIEDSAESLGSAYKGKASGTFGEFGIFSFNGNKIITTSGGGMLVSDNVEALEKARFLITQAKDKAPYYQHSEKGYNYRLSNISAGIGRAQLEVLNSRIAARRNVYQLYEQELGNVPGITFMPELENTFSNRWLTALMIDERVRGVTVRELITALEEENIEARHVWKPMHMQPLFDGCKYYKHNENDNISEQLFRSGLCLPSSSSLTVEEQMRVIVSIWNNSKILLR